MSRARAGEAGKLWIIARRQTEGRGRVGRAWSSPEGNLYASLLVVDPSESRHAPELGFVAGLALARAVIDLAGHTPALYIKWPNDPVHNGAKFAGILVEGTQTPSGAFAAVIGFGVNCRSHPSGLDYPTTDIESFAGSSCSPMSLLQSLSRHVVDGLALWDGGRNFAAVRDAWLALALPKGAPLSVKTSLSRTQGAFETIDGHGRLVFRTADGLSTVDAADVFLIGQNKPVEAGAGTVS